MINSVSRFIMNIKQKHKAELRDLHASHLCMRGVQISQLFRLSSHRHSDTHMSCIVSYETIKRKLKRRLIYESRWDKKKLRDLHASHCALFSSRFIVSLLTKTPRNLRRCARCRQEQVEKSMGWSYIVRGSQEFKQNVLGSHGVRAQCTDIHVSITTKPVN